MFTRIIISKKLLKTNDVYNFNKLLKTKDIIFNVFC